MRPQVAYSRPDGARLLSMTKAAYPPLSLAVERDQAAPNFRWRSQTRRYAARVSPSPDTGAGREGSFFLWVFRGRFLVLFGVTGILGRPPCPRSVKTFLLCLLDLVGEERKVSWPRYANYL